MFSHKSKVKKKSLKSVVSSLRYRYPLKNNFIHNSYSLTNTNFLDTRVKSLKAISIQKKKNFRLLKNLHNFSKTDVLKKSLSFRKNKWQETAEVRHFNRLSHRLDNVIFKTGFSFSLNQACQYISHGKVLVNGKRIHSRYHHLKSSDIVTFDRSLFSQIRFNLFANLSQKIGHCTLFLETNYAIFCIVVLKDLLGPQEHLLLSNPLIDFPKL